MKNLMLIAILLLPAFLFSQTETAITADETTSSKPKYFVGLELAGSGNAHILDRNMSPRLGYFISDKWVLGVYSEGSLFSRLRPSNLGVFARYYLPFDFSEKSDFLQRCTFFGEVSTKSRFTITDAKFDGNMDIGTHVGANIKLTDKLFLEAAVSPSLFGMNGSGPRIGLEMRFGKKK